MWHPHYLAPADAERLALIAEIAAAETHGPSSDVGRQVLEFVRSEPGRYRVCNDIERAFAVEVSA